MSIKLLSEQSHDFKRLINALMRGHVDYCSKTGKIKRIVNYKTPMEMRDDLQKGRQEFKK